MVRSLANVIFKKIWARLVLLRQRHLKTEENSMLQKELSQARKMSELAVSATEQIHRKVEKILEPKLDALLSKKIKVTALKTTPHKKEQHYKFKSSTREHLAKEPQIRDHSVDSGSTLASFAKRQVGVELSNMYSSDDEDNKKPSGKGESKPSGKGAFSRRGNLKPVFEPFMDCYGIDRAPMHIFENQIIPVQIHNISKSFKPKLDTIRVLLLGTKFIPKWEKTKTTQTFKCFNYFKTK